MLSFEHKITDGRISVIMPCYNAQAHLKESISNVLNQDYDDIELIVVDDGSTDQSKEILNGFGKNITVISQKNQGPGPARNRGLEKASGEFVAFLDSDDYWGPNCLSALKKALDNTNAALSYCGWQNVGGPKKQCQPYIPPDYEQSDKVERFLKSAAPWPIHAALVRRKILEEVSGFDEQWATCMDYDLWLRIGTRWPIVLVEQVLAFYRHNVGGQITSQQWRQARNVMLVKKHFINKFPNVVKHLSENRLKELVDGALLKRGYDAYWKRDLVSAHKIFRICLYNRYYKIKDLKYILPSILPENAFKKFVLVLEKTSE